MFMYMMDGNWTNWLVRVYVRYVIAIVVNLGTRQAGQEERIQPTTYIHVPTYSDRLPAVATI